MKFTFLLRMLAIVLLAWGISPSVFAGCYFSIGSVGTVEFVIPPIVISSDTLPGTVITTLDAKSSSFTISCDADGDIWQGYTVLTSSDLVTSVPQEQVYKTSVPGIGFRAAWANTNIPTFDSGYLISPWHKGSSAINQYYVYNLQINAVIQFIVTGPVSSGMINTNDLIADWKYENTIIGQLHFSPTQVNVQAVTCQVVDKNITVPLSNISTGDFDTNNVSPIVSDSRFSIAIEKCAPDIKVDYRFTSAGSTGVSNNNILNIVSGSGKAEGVGIQILDSADNVLTFDTDYTAVQKTTANQSFTIPLQARYIKTGTVKGGQVESVATFEVYYR